MELLNVTLSPEKHRSLAFSCADKLLLEFADQIIDQQELAIAYPCLNCRGGLSLFLSYLSLAIEQNPPGSTVAPVLVYPGTPKIREAYTGLKIRIGDLKQTLENIRIRSYTQGGHASVFLWEEKISRRINPTTIHMMSSRQWPVYVSGVRDKLDGSLSVSMRQVQ